MLAVIASGTLAAAALAIAPAAQQGTQDAGGVYVSQSSDDRPTGDSPSPASKVYFPDEITPESVAEARARAEERERLEAQRRLAAETSEDVPQIAGETDRATALPQLTDESVREALSQLSEAEREVVLEAISGTDICDDPPAVEAIIRLCESRIETRSQDFAIAEANRLTPEERLLGEGLEDTGKPDLAAVIERLARDASRPDDPNNQAIASVALRQPDGVEAERPAEEASQLSPATEDFINALVQQIGARGNQ